jgi:hypothetical protein
MDRRAEILLKETGGVFDITGIFNAMDENGKQMCLDLLEYMAKKKVICMSDEDGLYFLVRGESLTREQIFEDFL